MPSRVVVAKHFNDQVSLHLNSGRHVAWLMLVICSLISSHLNQVAYGHDQLTTIATNIALEDEQTLARDSNRELADSNKQFDSETDNNNNNDHQHHHFVSNDHDDNEDDDNESEYLVGVGIADITGPAAEINLMGYAKTSQDSGGIHLRQFCRSIVIEDKHGQRIVYSNLDNGMISQLLRSRVLARLSQQYGSQLYNESNVMMSATHSHSCPGGFFQYMLYNIPSAGFIQQSLDGLVDGVVRSIDRAHGSMVTARVSYNKGELLGASVNRSPTSYANNPLDERAQFEHNTDKEMFVLRFVETITGRPLAMLNWFAVHGTSMNNTNHLISSDNKGYAALLMEQEFNPPGTLPGQGQFVAIFAQANEGDVSPNTQGARCSDTGLPCDLISSTCGTPPRNDKCVASGPGRDMFESTQIIAYKQYQRARQLFTDMHAQRPVRGPVRYVHEHIDMTKQQVPIYESALRLAPGLAPAKANQALEFNLAPAHSSGTTWQLISRRQPSDLAASAANGQQAELTTTTTNDNNNSSYFTTCAAALGYSFAAGTTDGPGAFDFQQGDTATSRYWNLMRDFLKKPSAELQRCHQPKPILLATGEMDFPYMWHPRVIPTQMFLLGQVAIVGLPGEFTTMSGRRLRASVHSTLNSQLNQVSQPARRRAATLLNEQLSLLTGNTDQSNSNNKFQVVLSGLSNVYSSYVTTLEEYQVQRYESASTLYGPHTLQAYINQFVKLAKHLIGQPAERPLDSSLQPPDLSKSLFTLKAGVIFDGAPHGKSFGSVLEDVDQRRVYTCQQQVSVSFVAGNPRNDLRQEQSFLYVDKLETNNNNNNNNNVWVPIASDASWETKFIWERTNSLFGESKAIIKWDIPHNCRSGVYRIRHLGAHKNLLQTIGQYSGSSAPFKVIANNDASEPTTTSNSTTTTTTTTTAAELDQLMQVASQLNQIEANQRKQDQSNQLAEGSRARAKADAQATDRQPAAGGSSLMTAPLQWITSLFRLKG